MTINAEPDKHELLITAWLDNEISDAQRQEFEQLLASNPTFKAQFEQRKLEYDNLDAALRLIDKTPMPDNVMALLISSDTEANEAQGTISQEISSQEARSQEVSAQQTSDQKSTQKSENQEIQQSMGSHSSENPGNSSENSSENLNHTAQTASSVTADSHQTKTGAEQNMKVTAIESSKNIVQAEESKWFTPLSLAASVVMVGLLVLFYFDSDDLFEGSPNFRAQLHNALSNSLSGDTIPLSESQKIYINLTFLDKEYRYCREYFISQPEQATLHRIACRTHSQWQTLVETETQTSPLDTGANQIRTASGSSSSDIDAFLDEKMATDALEHSDEIKAIEKTWQILPEKS